jgi:probable HAF family extracellular repeat protein
VDINDHGCVAAVVEMPDPGNPGQSHARAFLWDPAAHCRRIVDLKNQDLDRLLSPNGNVVYDILPSGINNNGQIVGTVDTALAFLYQAGSVWNLGQCVPQGGPWQLSIANDINDAGQIVGQGVYTSAGTSLYTGFLLTPA